MTIQKGPHKDDNHKKIKSRNPTSVELRLFILYRRESYEGKLGSNALHPAHRQPSMLIVWEGSAFSVSFGMQTVRTPSLYSAVAFDSSMLSM